MDAVLWECVTGLLSRVAVEIVKISVNAEVCVVRVKKGGAAPARRWIRVLRSECVERGVKRGLVGWKLCVGGRLVLPR